MKKLGIIVLAGWFAAGTVFAPHVLSYCYAAGKGYCDGGIFEEVRLSIQADMDCECIGGLGYVSCRGINESGGQQYMVVNEVWFNCEPDYVY